MIAETAISQSSLVVAHTWLEALRSNRVMLSRPSSLLLPPPTSARHSAVSQGYWLSTSLLPGTTRRQRVRSILCRRRDGSLQFQGQDLRCCPWPSPTGNGLGSSSSTKRWTGVTTLQASLHVADWPVASVPLRTRPLNHARGHHYRGPWRLPGPDSHRQAALSYSFGYVTTTSSLSWRPNSWTHSQLAGS